MSILHREFQLLGSNPTPEEQALVWVFAFFPYRENGTAVVKRRLIDVFQSRPYHHLYKINQVAHLARVGRAGVTSG